MSDTEPDPRAAVAGPPAGEPDDRDGAGEPVEPAGFGALGLSERLLVTLDALGYDEPTPIQAESIPPLLDGFDLLGRAATGTGKTAAFALPMLERVVDAGSHRLPFGLVLVPTRELAIQVHDAIASYGDGLGVTTTAVYGGTHIGAQLGALRSGVDVVVGTPGRVLDHVTRGSLDLGRIGMIVLDEADEMLDMGFAEELEAILDSAPPTRQTVLFSATMPSRIDAIADRRLNDPVRIEIERARPDAGAAPAVRQVAYLAPRSHRAAALARVLEVEGPEAAIVFCRTRGDVDELTDVLTGRGYRADALHGGMGQEQRDRAMGRLKSGLVSLLVATDVAARGIDVDHLTHVVNFDVPQTGEAYVHRIGRVGRAGRAGVAITLGGPKDHRKLHRLADHTGHTIEILPVPGVAELVDRRRATTRDEVARLADDAADYRDLATAIVAEGHDPVDVAAAAIRRAHEALGRDREEEEIPAAPARSERRPDRRADRRDDRRDDRSARRPDQRSGERPRRPHRDRDLGSERGFQVEAGFVSLQFDLGRHGGVRPGDLVGAIANQAGIDGRDIGAIKINDRSSFVQVARRHAGKVVTHLDGATIRNRQVRVRRAR